MTTSPTYAIGDVHGQLNKLVSLLRSAHLLDTELHWAGGEERLWLLGDYVDRGSDGIGVVDLVRRLQMEATAAGGQVGALLGNHDMMLLAASRFGRTIPPGADISFHALWQMNGGRHRDLERFRSEQQAWVSDLPAMALVEDRLLVHADSTFYANYGQTVEEVNGAVQEVLCSDDFDAWGQLMGHFSRRLEFDEQMHGSTNLAREFLKLFGGRQIIHGHTPISIVDRGSLVQSLRPLVYAEGLCINVDGGMFMGTPGFVYRFE